MEHSPKKVRTHQKINVEPLSQDDKSTMEILNDHCLLEVFQYLPISDRIRLERVNKRWQKLSLASWYRFKILNFTRNTWGSYFDENQVTTIILDKVLDRCSKYVKHLDMFDYCFLVEEMSIDRIITTCHNLTSVKFDTFIADSNLLRTLANECTKIEILSIVECACTDCLIASNILSNYRNLKILNLKSEKMTGWGLQSVNANIEELYLECCCSLSFYWLEKVLPKLQNLRSLSLRRSIRSYLSKNSFSFLNLTNIKVLDISYNSPFINDKCLITMADAFKNLQSLDLSHNYAVTDEGLAAVTTFNLEHLRIDSLYHITGESLINLSSLKSLSCDECCNLRKSFVKQMLISSNKLHYLKLSNCSKVSTGQLIELAKRIANSRQNDIILKVATRTNDVSTFRMHSAKLLVYD